MREKDIENSERSRELIGNNQGCEPLVNCKGHQPGISGRKKVVSYCFDFRIVRFDLWSAIYFFCNWILNGECPFL